MHRKSGHLRLDPVIIIQLSLGCLIIIYPPILWCLIDLTYRPINYICTNINYFTYKIILGRRCIYIFFCGLPISFRLTDRSVFVDRPFWKHNLWFVLGSLPPPGWFRKQWYQSFTHLCIRHGTYIILL